MTIETGRVWTGRFWRAVATTDPKSASVAERLDEGGKRLRSLLMTALVILATVLVGLSAYDLLAPAVVVHRITVPKELQEAGYTPEATAALVVDGIRAAKSGGQDIAAAWKVQDLKLPGMELTLRSLLGFVKSAIPALQDTEISGEIAIASWPRSGTEPHVRLRLRADGVMHESTLSDSKPLHMLDELVRAEVGRFLDKVQPTVSASVEFHKPDKSDRLIAQAKKACDDNALQRCLSAHHLAGLRAYQCMDYARALAEFEVAIEHMHWWTNRHWKAVVWKNKGNALRRLERFEEAIVAYGTSLSYDRTLVTAYTSMGATYGRWAEDLGESPGSPRIGAAIDWLRLAQRQKRDGTDPHYQLGRIERALNGNRSAALQHFDAASELPKGDDVETPARLARAYRGLDDQKANKLRPHARKALAEHIESHPERVDLALDYANLLADFKEWEEAEVYYRAVAVKAPHYWVPLRNMMEMDKLRGHKGRLDALSREVDDRKRKHQRPAIAQLAIGTVTLPGNCYMAVDQAAALSQLPRSPQR
jgi:tetratricopeptide (TPR) repeat protein